MIPIVVASVLALGLAGILGLGVVQLLRRRPVTMPDYLELPAPPADELTERE